MEYRCERNHLTELDLKFWVYGSRCNDDTSLEFRVILSKFNPKEELIEIGDLSPERLMFESSGVLSHTDPPAEVTWENTLRVILDFQDEEWVCAERQQMVYLSLLIKCPKCERSTGPQLVAIFHVHLANTDIQVARFEGAIICVLRPQERAQKRAREKVSAFEQLMKDLCPVIIYTLLFRAGKRRFHRTTVEDQLVHYKANPHFPRTDIQLHVEVTRVHLDSVYDISEVSKLLSGSDIDLIDPSGSSDDSDQTDEKTPLLRSERSTTERRQKTKYGSLIKKPPQVMKEQLIRKHWSHDKNVFDLHTLCQDLIKEYGLREDVRIYSGNCPATMRKNWRKYNITVTHGEAKILQGEGSDVSLHIPEGSQGVYMTRVHTDIAQFQGVVPDDECLVGPPVEVEKIQKSSRVPEKFYLLKVPHCVQDNSRWKNIKVRRVDIYGSSPPMELKQRSAEDRDEDQYFVIEEFYIKIYTKKFSQFVCTEGCKTTCQASIMMILFGQLQHYQELEKTKVKINSFLCCDLFKIKDYKDELAEIQEEQGLQFVAQKHMMIKNKKMKPLESEVTMKITAAQIEAANWLPAENDDFLWQIDDKAFVRSELLPVVMYVEGCHLCRSPYPVDAMTVDMVSNSICREFDGKFDLILHVPATEGEDEAKAEPDQKDRILFQVPKRDTTRTTFIQSADADTPNTSNTAEPSTSRKHAQQISTGTPPQHAMAQPDPEGGNDNIQELTDDHIVKLSDKLSEEDQLRRLAIRGLKMKHDDYKKHLASGKSTVTAAYNILVEWQNKQCNRKIAFTLLDKALEKSGLNLLRKECLEDSEELLNGTSD